ncbi:MAG: hypothetical protein ACPGSD_04545 [Flavobacteriales bacterium]
MKKNKQDNTFIEKNLYTGKSSRSVYKFLKQSLWVNLIFLAFGLMVGYEISNFEAGKEYSLPFFVADLYNLVGKFWMIILWISIMVLVFIHGIYKTKELKNIKKQNNNDF